MFNLNLKEKERGNSAQENELYGGGKLNLRITLPDGRKIVQEFLEGQDVEWVKHFVAEQLQCSRNDFKLYFEGKHMIEILALCDIAGLKNNSAVEAKYNPGSEPQQKKE